MVPFSMIFLGEFSIAIYSKDKEDYRAIGTFLMFTADKKENLSNSEYSKAVREVDDVAIGRYEQTQKRGNSIKL